MQVDLETFLNGGADSSQPPPPYDQHFDVEKQACSFVHRFYLVCGYQLLYRFPDDIQEDKDDQSMDDEAALQEVDGVVLPVVQTLAIVVPRDHLVNQ